VETVKDPKMIQYQEFENIRQSPPWQEFMKALGWHIFVTPSKVAVFVFKTPFNVLNFGKIQKPKLLSKESLNEIDDVCVENKCSFVKIEPNFGQDVSVFDGTGFDESGNPLSPATTSIIDLCLSKEELWGNLSKSGKYGVNRAKREKTRVDFYQEPSNEKIDILYKMHHRTAKRNNFHARNVKDLYKRRDTFKKDCHLSLAFDGDGNICGGKMFQVYKGMVLFTYGGTSDLGRRNRSGFMLMWESLLYLKEKGYKFLDLEGMYDKRFPKHYSGWEGFSEFKEKFGVQVVKFPKPRNKFYSKFWETVDKTFNAGF
jgi:lipid II:glycine glycyltransferase (peptidoglycan interpeptide bridge formation enzyme)